MAKNILSLEIPDVSNSSNGVCVYEYCKKEYIKSRSSQKYCCIKCLRASVRQRKGRWVFSGEVINCKCCKTPLLKTDSNRVYCSRKCAKIYTGKLYYLNNKEKYIIANKQRRFNKTFRKHKKEKCELCGFIPINSCQLDVDHIDGNKLNNNIDNLQTLCANCHRLKTFLNKDGSYNRNKYLKAV